MVYRYSKLILLQFKYADERMNLKICHLINYNNMYKLVVNFYVYLAFFFYSSSFLVDSANFFKNFIRFYLTNINWRINPKLTIFKRIIYFNAFFHLFFFKN